MPDASAASSPLAAAQARIRALEAKLREAQAANQQLRLAARIPEQNPSPILRFGAASGWAYANPAADQFEAQLAAAELEVLRTGLAGLAGQSIQTNRLEQAEMPAGRYQLQVFVVPFAAEEYANIYLFDVTARHEAEQRVAEQRAFYESVLNELPSQIAVFGPDRRYRYLNARSVPDAAARAQWLGKTMLDTADFMGRPAAVAIHRHRLMEQAVVERRQVEWQEAYATPDGRVSHYLRYYQPVFGAAGGLEFVIAYNADITGRVQAEEQLRAQQTFTELVLDTTPNVIYVRDLAQNVLFQNRACRDLLAVVRPAGAPAPNGTQARERQAYAADDARVVEHQQELVAEDRVTLPSGEVRWYHTVKRPLPRPGGTTHILGVSTDITALKQAQHTWNATRSSTAT